MSNTEALHDHLMEMVDSDDHLIAHGSVRFNLFEHAFSLSVGALRDRKNDKELIAKQYEQLKMLRTDVEAVRKWFEINGYIASCVRLEKLLEATKEAQ